MTHIALHEPEIGAHEVRFSWTVTPASELYERSSFYLRFGPEIDLTGVSRELWWRIGLMCLHPHWPLLRPCRVELPVRLPPGEAEFWLRLTDAAVATLEAHVDGSETARSIELIGTGPLLSAPSPSPGRGDGIVSCFSGGRDSITQAAMLREFGESPTLVSVTSPVGWSTEHDTPRRREVLAAVTTRTGLELVEVHSDLRGNCQNEFVASRYGVGVNECTDALLYLGAAVAVAAARGARLVAMASEAELQESVKRRGMVIQTRHFMYSAATHRALSALLETAGVSVASLTNSLFQSQIQRLLAERYPDLRDLQYSCWSMRRDQAACSQCLECRRIALNLVAAGVAPSEAGIDLVTLLLSLSEWTPGERYLNQEQTQELPRHVVGRAMEMQELRCLAATPPSVVVAMLDGRGTPDERERAKAIYGRLHEYAAACRMEPEPGYLAGYLDLLAAPLRDGLEKIIEAHFAPAAPEHYAAIVTNTRLLSDWIADPLQRPPDASGGRCLETDPELRALIPDPEPELSPGPRGKALHVADTLLDGNESKYVAQCLADNWISSSGAFVARLEAAFATAVGCRHAIACSSGTAALHLAVAASGLGSGDEVLMPAFTMIATASASIYAGAEPTLIDADPASWNLDPAGLADKLSSRTRAVIVVHTYGQPAEMDAILELAARNRLTVIEDAAEAHGAIYKGRPVGSLGDVAAFSLYANKIITAGEGGMVTTNDDDIAALARELRDHAFSRERHFWHRRVGFNYRMTNLQAAVGLAQVERFEELIARRAENASRYREALAGVEGLGMPPEQEGGVSWMFGVVVEGEFGCGRDELRRRLAARGVETRTFFVPLHLQPVHYHRFRGQRYPVAEALGRTGLYLPSGPGLTPEDIAYVADAIRASQAAPAAQIA